MARKKSAMSKKSVAGKKKRVVLAAKDLPRKPLVETIPVIDALHGTYAGKSASFEDLAKAMGVGVNTNNTKYMIWSAEAYGLIKKEEDGTYSLSETGRKIVAPTYDNEDVEGKRKAVLTPTILSKFFSDYDGHPVPTEEHLPNVLETRFKVPRERVPEAVEIIRTNALTAAIFETVGSKELVRLEGVATTLVEPPVDETEGVDPVQKEAAAIEKAGDWSNVCFFIAPIGSEDSEVRKHSDMMLKHLVEPAARQHGLKVVRADQIAKSGLITQQILEYLAKSRLCVADLSFGNPNAFYELGVRHVFGLATIQISRRKDRIPFDVSQGRTIVIDTTDVYTIMDRLSSARRELIEHIKSALEDSAQPTDDNPISVYLPDIKVSIPRSL